MYYNRLKNFLLVLIFSFLLSSCVEPYFLPETAVTSGLLVVDGALHVEQGSGEVILSLTQQLHDTEAAPRVNGATVSAETEEGEVFVLSGQGNGEYFADGLPLQYEKGYRLRIQTADGREYLSDFMSTVKTPEIDTLTWEVEQRGVQVYLNTHDPANKARYYKWEYIETYEYNSGAESEFELVNGVPVPWPYQQRPYVCWKTDPGKNIVVGTSVKLDQDVIRSIPITYNREGTRQISRRYSVLVKQFAISKQEYEYWDMLRKNTENVGSLFDAQPSQIIGNIRNTKNPDEEVFGYFSVNSVTEKRLFVTANELNAYRFKHLKPKCDLDSLPVSNIHLLSSGTYIVNEVLNGPIVWGYRFAARSCVDCRAVGGTITRPDFW